MEIKPVKRYAVPDYPTRPMIDARPDLLRAVPRRWQGKPLVLAALAGSCVLLATACSTSDENAKKVGSHVAPLFVHGNGRGALGCVATNPPVFLSEDEARQVINEEAKRAGITFQPERVKLTRILAPVTYSAPGSPEGRTSRMTVEFDGSDKRHSIHYEYFSKADFETCRGWFDFNGSTVSVFNISDAARTLQKGLEQAHPTGSYAVFYDPCVGSKDVREALGLKEDDRRTTEGTPEEEFDRIYQKKQEMAREQLRLQVRDFIAWLKAQGVI